MATSILSDARPCQTCGGCERYSDGKCKMCVRARVAKYQKKNKEKVQAYLRGWRTANSEKIKNKDIVRCAEYRAKNPEKRKAATDAYVSKNKDKVAASKKQWKVKNPDQVRIHAANRRSRQSVGSLSRGIVKTLYKLQKGKCPCCKRPLGHDFHLDHKMPLALGGTNADDNVQLLRATCNMQKQAKHPIDFMQSRGFLL